MEGISKILRPIKNRIAMMLARGVVTLVNDGAMIQTLQLEILKNEVRSDMQRFQNYGFTSHPLPGAGGVAAFLGGNRDHGIVLAVDDRRYRVRNLTAGEVAIYDDLGHIITLKRGGIEIDGGGHQITVKNTPKVRMETPMLECTGDIKDNCDTQPDTLEDMRNTFNSHVHPENDSGGPTDVPNQFMGV